MLPIGDDNSQRRIFPFVTYCLIAVNILVFLLELAGGDEFITAWSFVPQRFISDPGGEFITIFTAMFMHAGWMHLGGNMLYLLIFGDNVEDRFGHGKFFLFYIAAGVVATFVQFIFSTYSNVPSLGASGAIAGVLAAYLLLFPARRVRVLVGIWVIRLPALLVIGVWIFLQFINGAGSISSTADTGGVAYMAHIGGFIAGFIMTLILRNKARPVLY